MSDIPNNPNADPLKADVQKALLAAFGEEAMDWLDEDDQLEGELQQLATEDSSSVEASETDGSNPIGTLNDLMERLGAAIEGTPTELDSTSLDVSSFDEDEDAVDLGPRYVVFEIGEQQFGIPLDGVLEIDRCGKVTPLPRTPIWLRGVTNLRGQIMSVTDFRELLRIGDQRRAVVEKIIVVQSESQDSQTALVVDRVLGIRNLQSEQGALDGLSDRLTVFADGLAITDQATTVLIDPDLLLGSDELSSFAAE